MCVVRGVQHTTSNRIFPGVCFSACMSSFRFQTKRDPDSAIVCRRRQISVRSAHSRDGSVYQLNNIRCCESSQAEIRQPNFLRRSNVSWSPHHWGGLLSTSSVRTVMRTFFQDEFRRYPVFDRVSVRRSFRPQGGRPVSAEMTSRWRSTVFQEISRGGTTIGDAPMCVGGIYFPLGSLLLSTSSARRHRKRECQARHHADGGVVVFFYNSKRMCRVLFLYKRSRVKKMSGVGILGVRLLASW